MTPKTKKILVILSLAIFLFAGNFASAAIVDCGGDLNHENECTVGDLIEVVIAIINILLSWAWLVSMVFIIWGGWQMVTSEGNEEKIASGKTIFSQAIIGFFLIMASFILTNAVVAILSGTGQLGPGAWIKAFNLLP